MTLIYHLKRKKTFVNSREFKVCRKKNVSRWHQATIKCHISNTVNDRFNTQSEAPTLGGEILISVRLNRVLI